MNKENKRITMECKYEQYSKPTTQQQQNKCWIVALLTITEPLNTILTFLMNNLLEGNFVAYRYNKKK